MPTSPYRVRLHRTNGSWQGRCAITSSRASPSPINPWCASDAPADHIGQSLCEDGKSVFDVYAERTYCRPTSTGRALMATTLAPATDNRNRDRWASGVTPYAEMGYYDADYQPK